MSSFVALGAHLRSEDVEGVEGAVSFPARGLFISAVSFQHPETTAARSLLSRAAAVRQRLIEREIFVAIRYGLTFTDAQEAESHIAAHDRYWQSLLEEWRGHVELTLKVVGEEKGVRPDRHASASGKDYLEALQALRRKRGAPLDFREEASRAFAPVAAAQRWVTRPDGASELALVTTRDTIAQCRDVALALRDRFDAVPFLFSGPWPLETFADES